MSLIKIKSIQTTCYCCGGQSEMFYLSFHDSVTGKQASFVTYYCENCPRGGMFGAFWKKEMIIRLCEYRVQNKTYQEITDSINKEFGTEFTLSNSSHGYKGAVVKKLEHLKENSVEWEKYTNDAELKRDTDNMFKNKRNTKNRYFKTDGLMKWERPTYHSEREDY